MLKKKILKQIKVGNAFERHILIHKNKKKFNDKLEDTVFLLFEKT